MADQQTVIDLGKLVKQKYPGAYDSMPDLDVGRKVKAKYPQYSQFADIVPGMERLGGVPPAAGKPPAPEALQDRPYSFSKEFLTSPRGLIRGGAGKFAEGVEAFAAGDPAKGTSDVLRGSGEMLAPAGIPFALANPVPAVLSAAGGLGASEAGKAVARGYGAPENVEQAVGDVSGLLGGAVAGRGARNLTAKALARVLKSSGVRSKGFKAFVPHGKEFLDFWDEVKKELAGLEASAPAATPKAVPASPGTGIRGPSKLPEPPPPPKTYAGPSTGIRGPSPAPAPAPPPKVFSSPSTGIRGAGVPSPATKPPVAGGSPGTLQAAGSPVEAPSASGGGFSGRWESMSEAEKGHNLVDAAFAVAKNDLGIPQAEFREAVTKLYGGRGLSKLTNAERLRLVDYMRTHGKLPVTPP